MKRAGFTTLWLPILLLVPQLSIIAIFFYWPALHAVTSSFYLQDPFGFSQTFVGFENYAHLARSDEYLKVANFTVLFTVLVTFFSLALALLLAVKADKVLRGAKVYRTLFDVGLCRRAACCGVHRAFDVQPDLGAAGPVVRRARVGLYLRR